MSTKGDPAVKPASSSSFFRPPPEIQTAKPLTTSPNTTSSTSPVFATSLNPSFTNSMAPLLTEGSQRRTATSPSAALNFSHRFPTKSPLRALTIDTTGDSTPTYMHEENRLGSFSATHNTAHQHVHTRNSLISSLNANQSAKYSRAIESYRRPDQASSSKNSAVSKSSISSKSLATGGFPSKVPWVLGNDYTSSLLSSISPTSSHFKKMNTKSYSQERHRVGVYGSFDTRSVQAGNLRKISTATLAAESNRSFNTSESRGNNQHSEKSEDISLHTIFNSLKTSFSTPNTTNGKKIVLPLPNHEPTKCSVKRNGIVKAYAANTNQGIVRNYNEDRVSIILNIMKPASRSNEEWPKCSFFGIYDGHGGVGCADFLRDQLHQYVIKEPSFPLNPKEALMKGFEAAERAFLELAIGGPNREFDRSGSCCLVVLIVGEMCYVANVGDSRAVMSGDGGAKVYPLSKDHKPNEENETKRIFEAGGKIYQSQGPAFKQNVGKNASEDQMQLILGPHRVFPGRLSVSRTFGDIEAKLPKLGGNPNVVIAVPDIKAFKISPDHDFIIFASDGIFDKLSSRDVIKTVWASTEEKASNIHHQCGLGVESVLTEAINRRTLDNVTVVMICFKNFKQKLFPQEHSRKSESLEISQKDIGSPTDNEPCTFEAALTKEISSLQEKANMSERKNPREKPTFLQQSMMTNMTNTSIPSPGYTAKRPAAALRDDSPDSKLFLKSKAKESMPISDIHLLSKRLAAKRSNEIQNSLSLNRSLQSHGSGSTSLLAEKKIVKTTSKPDAIKT